jgi:hypothetical protein
MVDVQDAPKAEVTPHDGYKGNRLRVYGHSNFFYWWVVWAYGFVCAAFTVVLTKLDVTYPGNQVIPAGKGIVITSHPWIGVSFTGLLLAVAFLTNFRLKGTRSVIAILSIVVLTLAIHELGWWDAILAYFPHLLIFMNLAFYITVSTVLLALWLLATFVLDRLTIYEFTPGQVTRRSLVGDGTESFDATGLHVDRVADDYFINRVLGLGFIPGWGTADMRITTGTTGVRDKFVIENVLGPGVTDERIRKLMAIKPDM